MLSRWSCEKMFITLRLSIFKVLAMAPISLPKTTFSACHALSTCPETELWIAGG
jgi:hypothetical protein